MASCSANNSAESGVNNKPSKGETVTTNQTNTNTPTGIDGGKQEVTPSETSEATPLNSANMESVIVEGVGKTEASAKKAAYKEAVAKVVGVLIDSSTLVKNDKIIEEELLEYSGGFVSKAELVSSKKDDEGLVRVKVRCVVEKAQIRKKLEDIKVLVVKVDGASIAAKEMTKAEMQKNATTLVNKALEERKKIYELKMPLKLENLDEQENGCVYFPVSIEFNKEKHQVWLDKWLPVFEKIALEKEEGVINYIFGDIETDLVPTGSGNNFITEIEEKSKVINRSQSVYFAVSHPYSIAGLARWTAYRFPCNSLDLVSATNYLQPNSTEIKFQIPSYAKMVLQIENADKELVYSCESRNFGNLRHKLDSPYYENPNGRSGNTTIASPKNHPWSQDKTERITDYHRMLPLHLLGFAPGHRVLQRDGKAFIAIPGNFGCYFEVDMKKLKSFKITSVSSKLEWTEVIR
jgi:hypothetical protein